MQLEKTVARITAAVASQKPSFELVLVDDGSNDDTWMIIGSLKEHTTIKIRGVRLKQNIGAYYAIVAGMQEAKGDAILIMAADGDDPPELIPELLLKFSDRTDAVLANKKQSEKSPFSILLGRVFLSILNLLGAKNLTSGGSDFLLFQHKLFDKANADGWKSGNTLVQILQHARNVESIDYTKGSSRPTSWSVNKKIKLFLQTMRQFIWIPFVRSKAPVAEVMDRS